MLQGARLDGRLDEIARASLLNRIGQWQASLGQYAAAEKTHREAVSLREKELGKEHEQTLTSMDQLGVALWYQGKENSKRIYLKLFEINTFSIPHYIPISNCKTMFSKDEAQAFYINSFVFFNFARFS